MMHAARRVQRAGRFSLAVCLVGLVVTADAAKIKIQTHQDKTYDFKKVTGWSWAPDGAGEVKMARSPDDDPERVRQRVEPTIKSAVGPALGRRGLILVAPSAADLHLRYYALVTISTSTQQLGQFVPAVPEWGLPPMTGATTAFTVMTHGALVLDAVVPATHQVVWRGVAQADIAMDASDRERDERIRDAVNEMLGKFPARR